MRSDPLDRALEQVSDGIPVDWERLERTARSEEDRQELDCARLLERVVSVHNPRDGDARVHLLPKAEPDSGSMTAPIVAFVLVCGIVLAIAFRPDWLPELLLTGAIVGAAVLANTLWRRAGRRS